MALSRSDIADLAYFLAIARHRSFRAAGVEAGVSASALSHALKGLEARLGVRLLNRTSRSVTLTAAGEELLQAIDRPFEAIRDAGEALNRFRDAPVGRVRLNVPEVAARFLLAPALPGFLQRYPGIQVEVAVSNRMLDVIENGFDAGVRFGGTVPADMVAQRVSADIRWVVAAAPSYLERCGAPESPADLQRHAAVQLRQGDGAIYRWELERGDEAVAIAPPGPVITDDLALALSLGRAGAGLIYAPELAIEGHLRSGELRLVLEPWAAWGEGLHVYHSSRRQAPAGLRLLIAHLRDQRPLGL